PMYILKVNIGTEIRTIIAGIKDHYQKQDLLNKNVVVIANLKPKTIMGIESKGMLLIADDGTDISLVFPEKELKLGAKIE
ncbi:MAG: methionine--tRNA ligase, partial [Candidatus Marsarchaeota archaeon]|nr:methionine--tRNA ligase [Candidatus Marsarchaeota archaeon]